MEGGRGWSLRGAAILGDPALAAVLLLAAKGLLALPGALGFSALVPVACCSFSFLLPFSGWFVLLGDDLGLKLPIRGRNSAII